MPGSKHPCPASAACWSPAIARTGIAAPRCTGSATPNGPDVSRTSGSTAAGMRNSASNSGSHAPSWMFSSMVREALVTSVACTAPFVRRQSSHVSTVPNASRPASAAARAPGTSSSNQASLVAEKYGSSRSPVRCSTNAPCPAASSAAQAPAVRRSCQTIARWTGRPVARSHSSVVSRWFAMPIAATSRASTRPRCSAARAVASVVRHRSSGSCSTQPGCG